MKRTLAISIFLLLCVCGYAQQDTLRENYENGSPRFIYPTLEGQHHGVCKRWYPNGQLWSEGEWHNGIQDGVHFSYFEDGTIQMKFWFRFGQLRKSQLYHRNGNRSLFSWTDSNGSKKLFWYETGEKLKKENHMNGHSITCSAPISLDGTPHSKEDEACHCGDAPVFWKDSIYVDSKGKPVNSKYKLRMIEWFENGELKSKVKYKKGKGWRREWNKNEQLIKDEKYS